MAEARDQLQKLTECCICFKSFTDPRMLPCLHTFCLDCVKQTAEAAKKKPGAKIQCPLCRKEFVIPVDGIGGLQKNFFMEHLMDVTTMLQPDNKPFASCVICDALQEGDEKQTKEATMRCLECGDNFCDMCSRAHKLHKLSKTHTIVKIGYEAEEDIRKMQPTRNCPIHNQQLLNFYCADCKKIICVSCFVENHSSHICKDVTTVEKEFRKTIEINASKISKCAEEMLLKGREAELRAALVLSKLSDTEDKIRKENLKLKEMIDSHTKSLLDELSLIKQKQVKEIANDKEEIERSHTILRSFEIYCTELRSKGSASDICVCVDELVTRANELEKDHEEFLGRPNQKTEVSFQATNLEELLKTCSGNIVGQVQKTRSQQKLRNFGNTNYFNTVVYCLRASYSFIDEFRSTNTFKGPKTDACLRFWNSKDFPDENRAFSKLFERFIRSSPTFNKQQRHDSHDLFLRLLNDLKSDERLHAKKLSQSGLDPREVLTAVDKVFGGHVLIKYACLTCDQPSFVCEPVLDISLPISEQQGNNSEEGMKGIHQAWRQRDRDLQLTECLKIFTTALSIPKSYSSSFCSCKSGNDVHVVKHTEIYSPPAVLVLHLKRFEKTVNGFTKTSDSVTYEELLDLRPYCSLDCLRIEPGHKNVWYSLFGVVAHNGPVESGNYTAYIKARDSNADAAKAFLQKTYLDCNQVSSEQMCKWNRKHKPNDRKVRIVRRQSKPATGGRWSFVRDNCTGFATSDEALSQEAFMLFYERVS